MISSIARSCNHLVAKAAKLELKEEQIRGRDIQFKRNSYTQLKVFESLIELNEWN